MKKSKSTTTRTRGQDKATKIQIAEAIMAGNGLYTGACKYLKEQYEISIERHTLAGYIANDEELIQTMNNAKERIKDIAESVLLKNLVGADQNLALRASEFYLRTQAKDRGYTTGAEVQTEGKLEVKRSYSDKEMKELHNVAEAIMNGSIKVTG